MRFRRAVSITVDCFTDVLKLVLYRIVVGVIFYSLIYLILSLGLSFIVNSEEFQAFGGIIMEFFRALAVSLVQGDAARLVAFQSDFHTALLNFATLLLNNMGSIVGSLVGVACMYILRRIANGLAQFAIASSVNDRMSVYAHTRFAVSFFKNLGLSALYQVIYVPLAFLYDLGSLVACWFLFFYIPSLLPGWGVLSVLAALSLIVAAVILLQALKLTVISAWMPAILVDKMSVFGAMKKTFRCRKDFGRRFAGFVVACYLIVAVNMGFAIFTAGSGLLFTVPLSFIFLIVLQFVNYYETEGVQYFVAKDEIAGPKSDSLE